MVARLHSAKRLPSISNWASLDNSKSRRMRVSLAARAFWAATRWLMSNTVNKSSLSPWCSKAIR